MSLILAKSFLGVLPSDVLGEIAVSAAVAELPAGVFIYEPELVIVARGLLRAFVADSGARQVTVSYVRAPGVIGLAHLAGRGFPVAFQTVTDCELVEVSQPFAELVDRFPRLGWSATREVTSRLDQVLSETTRVAFGSMRQRLAFHLLNLTSIDGEERSGPVKPRDLVLAVGTVSEVIRRTVIQCQATGLVSVSRDGVVVTDRPGLQRIADSYA